MPKNGKWGDRSNRRGRSSSNNNQNSNSNSGSDYKKNNGCKSGTDKNGAPWINGWNFSKDRGFVKVNIHPYKNSKEVKSDNGKTHLVMMANIIYEKSGMQDHYPVTYCKETGYVQLKKHGWILNPKKGNMTRFTGGN